MLDEKIRSAIVAVRDEAAARGVVATFSLHRERSHLMRLGNSSVSLNTSEDLTRLDVEVTDGRRQGSQTLLGDIDGPAAVRETLDMAAAKAAVAMPKDFEPIPGDVEEPVHEEPQHDPALADLDPAVKAEGYRRIMKGVGTEFDWSGSWSSGLSEQYVTTTAGTNEAWHRGTDQQFTIVLKHPTDRWELQHQQTGWRASDFVAEATIEHLSSLVPLYRSASGVRVEPGEYDVLFGADALAEIAMMAIWTGLYGRSWEEKLGWTLNDRIGDRILGENVTVVDDPDADGTFRFGFDLSGRRRRCFPLVTAGRLEGLMYDSAGAAKYGRRPTAHDIGTLGIVMATGDGPEDPLEATRGRGRVLSIPAIHYTNIPNRSAGMLTGSSRFNAIVIENGEAVAPLFSSRVTDTFRNMLSRIAVLSSRAQSVNMSNTYGRRTPLACVVPSYALVERVRISDSAASF